MVLAIGSFEKVVDEVPAHFFRQDAGVLVVVVAAGQQRGEQDPLELRLREEDEGQVAKLLKNRRLLSALNDHLQMRRRRGFNKSIIGVVAQHSGRACAS